MNTCSGVGDNEEGPKDYVYSFELKHNANGNYGLFLTQGDGAPYGTFYPRGDDPNPGPKPELVISGTLHAPAGGDVQGAVVFACVLIGDNCDEAKSRASEVTSGGESAAFAFDGLEAISYYLFAVADVNGDGDLGAGDYLVEYGEVTATFSLKPSLRSSLTSTSA